MGTDGEQHFIFASLISINWQVITQEWGTRKSRTGSLWYIMKITCDFSLPSRDLIADSIEAVVMVNLHHLGENALWLPTWLQAQHYDGNISIPGCDKNMPGCFMAAVRHNRPTIIVYGGTIQPGARHLGASWGWSWDYTILIRFCRLSFDGEKERRNRQYFRCFRIIWYMQLNLFACLLLKVPKIKGRTQWVISQMKSGSTLCGTPVQDLELVAACSLPTQWAPFSRFSGFLYRILQAHQLYTLVCARTLTRHDYTQLAL